MKLHALMQDALVSITGLKTHFFTERGIVKAVDDVDFAIGKREIVGLVGESGSGKSTLGLSIMRLVSPPGKIVGGSIFFDGDDLTKKTDSEMRDVRGRLISMIFQDPLTSLDPSFTIGAQISETMKHHTDLTKREIEDRGSKLLGDVGIAELATRLKSFPHQLSGGMQQRVMVAIALSCNPRLLIADEPTTNLDVTVQAQVLDLLRELRKGYETSILLITHDLGVIAEMCDRVTVMYAGKVAESATVERIFSEPMHPYTRMLMRITRTLSRSGQKLPVIPGTIPDLISVPEGCIYHPRCQYADEMCRRVTPQPREVERGHFVACHYAEKISQEG